MIKKLAKEMLLFYVATLIYMLIAIYGFFSITDIDSDLSPEFARELAWPKPKYDKQNSFYAFLGLAELSSGMDLWDVGWEISETDYKKHQVMDESLNLGATPQSSSTFRLSCNVGVRSCFADNIELSNDALTWIKKNSSLNEAVNKIISSENFYEQISVHANYLASWQLFDAVRQANWAIASHLWSQDRNIEAVEMIRPYLNFCRKLLKTSSQLLSRSLAIGCVVNDMRLLAEWYLVQPTKNRLLSEQLIDWLKPILLEEIRMKESLLSEVRLYTRRGQVLLKPMLQKINIQHREELLDLEKMDKARFVALVVAYTIKPNDIARSAYQKFEGLLHLSDVGVPLAKLPWSPTAPKPLKAYLPRSYLGYVLPEIPIEMYEHYIHNAHSPVIYQSMLSAVIFCSEKITKNEIKNCLRFDISHLKGPFYNNPVKWYSDQRFLWLAVPDALAKRRGEAQIHLDL
jgi:hypothetical protein